MDRDENDLLSTNVFIPKPELASEVPTDGVDEFKAFYLKNLELENQNKIINEIKNIKITDDAEAQDNDLLNTNAVNFSKKDNLIIDEPRKTKEVKTYVNIDSRDRDKTIYKKPNHFKIFLSKTFYNVKSIKLASIEFPNTDAVINDRNKHIYWRNQEDIDEDITVTQNEQTLYPTYSTSLRVGRYTASSLQTEIINKMNKVKRRNGQSSDFHYFVVTLDLYTDIVTFVSLILTELTNNPFSVTAGDNIITVTAPSHNYTENESVYILGSPAIGGIPATSINGFRSVILIPGETDKFRFQVNINANETVVDKGGSTIKVGKQAPFQILWGGHTTPLNTFAPNLGFPLEDSSIRIYTKISRLENIYLMRITTTMPHMLTDDYIKDSLEIGYISPLTGLFQINTEFTTKMIIIIPSSNTILVRVDSDEMTRSISQNISSTTSKIRFDLDDNKVFDVSSYGVYNTETIMMTTYVDHRYDLGDVRKTVTLYNTQDLNNLDDTSNYDGPYTILQRLSSTELILPGRITENVKENIGYIPRHTPLETWIVSILNVSPSIIPGYTTITCSTNHKLIEGDTIRLVNVNTSPVLNKNNVFIITNVTNNKFDIERTFTNASVDSSSFVSTGLMTLSFPDHNFNQIIDIEKVDNSTVNIQTIIPHGLETGDKIRIMETNTTPDSIDDFYEITKIDDDEFTITGSFTSLNATMPSNITGILGISNNFNLYGIEDIANISATVLDGEAFTVRDIIDENTFTFYVQNSFANSITKGGGENTYISSYKHGYSGVQTNTKDDILNRSINLEGENYCFLTCPQLDTMKNTGSVKNIFARISLDQAPGYICFNFLSNPKDFDKVPLSTLGELEFSCINYDGSFYDFNDLDYSFVLEITEIIDDSNTFNISSRRGIKYT